MNDKATNNMDGIDFLSPATIECPYAANRIARQHAPVYRLPDAGLFYVSSYELVKKALADVETFSNDFGAELQGGLEHDAEVQEIVRERGGWPERNTLLTNDPPRHPLYRALVNTAFSAKRVNALEPYIAELTNSLIDTFIESGRCDFVAQFAALLPLYVIADTLGLPRADVPKFKLWTDAFTDRLGGQASRARLLECTQQIIDYQHYMHAQLEQRRREPRDDMLSELVHARLGDERELDTAELLTICHELLVAGNETTGNTLAEGMLLFIQNPLQREKIVQQPQLLPRAVEELLRYIAPAQGMLRVVKRDTELGGVKIPAGARVVLRFVSANRDESVFSDPETFDIERSDSSKHISFGQGGGHTCIGQMLARKELTTAFRVLLQRLRNPRLAPGKNDLQHVPNLLLRGLKQLHIEFDF